MRQQRNKNNKSRIFVAVCGLAGVGKTTIMRKFMEGKKWEEQQPTKLLRTYYNKDLDLFLLGIYNDELYSGTDRLSMAVQPDVENWLNTHNSNVLFEGDRLSNISFLTYVSNLSRTNFKIYYIEIPKELREKRYKERGSNQTQKILKSRETKYKGIINNELLRPYIHIVKNIDKKDKENILELLENNFNGSSKITYFDKSKNKIGINKFL